MHYLEQELRALIQTDANLFEFLRQGALDGLWYWDLTEPEHEWMDSRFWISLGYDPAEKQHLTKEWQDLIFAEDLEVALDNFNQHCQDPQHPYDQIVRYRHRNGSVVWVRCRGLAIRDADNKPIRMLGVHSEVTQLKRTEQQLTLSNQELSDFAYAAAHDLKSPLRAIEGQLSLLKNERYATLTEEGEQLITNAVAQTERMSSLIKDLLDFAQFSQTQKAYQTLETEVLLHKVAAEFEPMLKQIDADLEIQSVVSIHANEQVFEQIVRNLISNAIKYRREGVPLLIRITGEARSDHWRFSISDNGIGIAPEHHGRIFQAFQRLHSKDEIEGSGLGLNLCQKAVAFHQGQLWVEAELNKGSTFYFTIQKGLTHECQTA